MGEDLSRGHEIPHPRNADTSPFYKGRQNLVYKALKVFEIIKRFIYGSESDVNHGIHFFQCSENIITDFLRGDFVLVRRPFYLEIVDEILYFFLIDFSLGESKQKRFFEFLPVIHLLAAVHLDDDQFRESFPFERRKPMLTIFAFSPSSDALTVFNHSRIDDFGFHTLTLWTLHFYFGMKR